MDEGTRNDTRESGTAAYHRVPSRTFAYQPSILLMSDEVAHMPAPVKAENHYLLVSHSHVRGNIQVDAHVENRVLGEARTRPQTEMQKERGKVARGRSRHIQKRSD